jgi:hypothetical protein
MQVFEARSLWETSDKEKEHDNVYISYNQLGMEQEFRSFLHLGTFGESNPSASYTGTSCK